MDSKALLNRAAQALGTSPEKAADAAALLTEAIAAFAAEGSSVAIPGFGTFTPVMSDERIAENPDGTRTLLPPAVSLDFTASVILRKKLQ